MTFKDREEAGDLLAQYLAELRKQGAIPDVSMVLALPRGGLPVAVPIARALNVPLDVFVARKIGSPENPEYGIGAITETGFYRLKREYDSFDSADRIKAELDEARRRVRKYRGNRRLPDFRGHSVMIVDDGIATGITAAVTAEYLREAGARRVLIAAPVGARSSVEKLRGAGATVVCLLEEEHFMAVGDWYENFPQLGDEDVLRYLTPQAPIGADLQFPRGSPESAKGVVIFAHGSGSNRMSPRNRAVAQSFLKAGLGTLLFDLLNEEESSERDRVFDIPLLADRLVRATQWLGNELKRRKLEKLPVGYFGASTGAAAALWAASLPDVADEKIAAIVSRGGRPDLASGRLQFVRAPTLLIVGGNDEAVLKMNRSAMRKLRGAELVIVAGASHLFEEPGALEEVAFHASHWFTGHFSVFKPRFGKVA